MSSPSNPYCMSLFDCCHIDPGFPHWFQNHFCAENYVEFNYRQKVNFTTENDFQGMTREYAQIIRVLRISGCTWGRISEIMESVTNTNEQWGQYDGQRMCYKAEKFYTDPEFSIEEKWIYERLNRRFGKKMK